MLLCNFTPFAITKELQGTTGTCVAFRPNAPLYRAPLEPHEWCLADLPHSQLGEKTGTSELPLTSWASQRGWALGLHQLLGCDPPGLG